MLREKRLAREVSLKIIQDHGYERHIGEFKKDGVTTRGQMMDHIVSTLNDPDTKMIIGGKGETLFYNSKSNTFICDNKSGYNSTCFKSQTGPAYFQTEYERVKRDRTVAGMPPPAIERVDLAKAKLEHARNEIQKSDVNESKTHELSKQDKRRELLEKTLGTPDIAKEQEFDKDDYTKEK